MKLFTKIALGLAGFFASVAVICTIIAFAMGFTTNDFLKMLRNGNFSISIKNGQIQIFGLEEDFIIKGDNDILEEGGNENSDVNSYEVKEDCRNLDIEFGAGILNIYYDDVECIQVKQTNIPNLKVNVKNETLVISEGSNFNIGIDDMEDRSLTILIPRDMRFEEVELEIGASKADIKDIHADDISIMVGAGQADISKFVAKQFKLEVGAGQATVVQLDVERLNVEAGMGQVNIDLNGVQEDYNYNVECGIGNVTVGSASYGGLGAEQSVKNEGATKEINVECGIGEVRIKFKR